MADPKKFIFNLRSIIFFTSLLFFPTWLTGQTAPDNLAGRWERVVQGTTLTIVFEKDGAYEVEFTGDDQTDVTGKCTIKKDQITFQDSGGMAAPEPGIYSFTLKDDKITFVIIDDPSNGRSALLPGTWTKKEI